MRDDFDMNDIILSNDNTNNTNIKKILTAIAILVVLFLIVLIIMKFINKGSVQTDNELIMPSEEQVFSPKTEPVQTTQPQIVITQELAKEVSSQEKPQIIVHSSEEQKDVKLVEIIKSQEEPKDKAAEPAKMEKPAEPIKSEPAKVEPAKTQPLKVEPPVKAPIKPEPKNEPVKKPGVTKTQESTQSVKKELPKEVKKLAQQSTKPAKTGTVREPVSTLKAGNYIQIFALNSFSKNQDFNKKLTQKGYDVIPHKTKVKGKNVIKVLVGPYSGDELQNSLNDVKENINKQAFIFKVN